MSDQALSSSQSSTEVEDALDILPVILLGMVRQEEGGLALADLTGHVLCEVHLYVFNSIIKIKIKAASC